MANSPKTSAKKENETSKYDVVANLKKFCDGCKLATIKSYARNIRRLAKIAGLDTVPNNKGWLSTDKGKKLRNKIQKDFDVSVSRHLYTAGSQAFRMYSKGERSAPWQIAMNDAANKYDVQRHKQIKSKSEEDNWPKEAYRSIAKAATIQKRKVLGLLKKTEYTNLERYEIQKYIVLLLFSHHTFRLTPATWSLVASKSGNTLLRPRGSRQFIVTLREHKTKKAMGELEVPLSLAVSKVLSTYLPKIKKNSKHNYFLSNKDGSKLSKGALSKLLIRLTKSILGSNVGVRLMRVLKMSSPANSELLKKSTELQKELGHSQRTARTYVRKD